MDKARNNVMKRDIFSFYEYMVSSQKIENRREPKVVHVNILIKKVFLCMKRVKEAARYWCRDTAEGKYLGSGVCAAVLDTGIAPHPDFGRRVLCFRDFVNGKHQLYDDSGHGTHVSGILAGSGYLSGGIYAGMAPEADLIIGKVLDHTGNGSVEWVMRGIEWILAVRSRYHVRIVNISVGTKPDLKKEQKALLVYGVEKLWDAGLVVIVSAGNYGPGKGSVAVPGVSPKVITVGVYETGNSRYPDQKSKWSRSGTGPTAACIMKPDLVAPGLRVFSCNRNYFGSGLQRRPYISRSGTSMAAPVVAGAVACLLSKYPDMTNVEVKLKLRESCQRSGEEEFGWGMLNVAGLLE